MKKKLLLSLTTAIVVASSASIAYADGIQIENDLESNYSLTNKTNDAVSYEKLEGEEFQNVATINSNGNTYMVYYNDEIRDNNGYKYKIHGITINWSDSRGSYFDRYLYMKAEIIERPVERVSYGKVSMEAAKNDVAIDLNTWDANFLRCNVKGNLSAFLSYSDYTCNIGSTGFWELCDTSNEFIESGNTIKIYIRSK